MTATIEQLKEKIELFRKNIKDYKSKDYDEYNTRADFIDVLFSVLKKETTARKLKNAPCATGHTMKT